LVKIFIVYGGSRGEKIGKSIDDYFKINRLGSFFASPKAHNVPHGEDFQPHIDRALQNSDVAVIVSTTGIRSSAAALKETDLILDVVKIPIIIYLEKGTIVPDRLKGKWRLDFAKDTGSHLKNLRQLELEVWRLLDRKRTAQPLSQAEGQVPPPEYYGAMVT